MAARASIVCMRKRRSKLLSLMNLAHCRGANLQKPLARKLLKQCEQMLLTLEGIHVIFSEERVTDARYLARFLDHLPNACSGLVEPMVNTALEIEYHDFA